MNTDLLYEWTDTRQEMNHSAARQKIYSELESNS